MSRFDHILRRAARFGFGRYLGSAGTVTVHDPATGDIAIATAVIGPISQDDEDSDQARGRQRTRRRFVLLPTLAAAADDGVAWTTPRDDAEITVNDGSGASGASGGERWAVERIEDASASGFARVHLVDLAVRERSRPGYRGRVV